MGLTPKEALLRTRREAFASCAIMEAGDPTHAMIISHALRMDHTPITREDVERNLGKEASEAWDEAKSAMARLTEVAFAAACTDTEGREG